MTVLLNSIWGSVVSDIAKSRKISVDSLNSIANSLGANTKCAKQKHLIDKIAYEDEYHDGIRKALGVEKAKKYNKVSILITPEM